MRPPQIAPAIALTPGRLAAVAVILAMAAVVALLVALRRQSLAPPEWTDVNEPLKRLRAFHLFGPDEDEEPVVHVPVRRETGATADAALARVALFAERAPVAVPAHADPSAAPPPPADALDAEAAQAPPARPVASTALQPSTRTRGELPLDGDILLVEDDVSIASMYQLMLRSRGYTARHAHDGVEGIAMVRDRRPALILLDMMMPRMDGLQFLEALRGWPKTSFIPVVVLSNTDNQQLVDRALALGAVEYLIKAQMRPQVIVGALPHWLRGNRALSGVS